QAAAAMAVGPAVLAAAVCRSLTFKSATTLVVLAVGFVVVGASAVALNGTKLPPTRLIEPKSVASTSVMGPTKRMHAAEECLEDALERLATVEGAALHYTVKFKFLAARHTVAVRQPYVFETDALAGYTSNTDSDGATPAQALTLVRALEEVRTAEA